MTSAGTVIAGQAGTKAALKKSGDTSSRIAATLSTSVSKKKVLNAPAEIVGLPVVGSIPNANA